MELHAALTLLYVLSLFCSGARIARLHTKDSIGRPITLLYAALDHADIRIVAFLDGVRRRNGPCQDRPAR